VRAGPPDLAKVVSRGAAAENQYPFFAERRKRTPHGEMMCGVAVRLDRNLDHRYRRVRIHKDKGRPDAMVEAPLRVGRNASARRVPDEIENAPAERRIAWRTVSDSIKFFRKSVKIVNGRGMRRKIDGNFLCFPVRGNADDSARAAQFLCEAAEKVAGGPRFEYETRRSVRNENSRSHRDRARDCAIPIMVF
jgi:hypothetical protein